MKRRAVGFTLVELLVVIAIIGVLVSLLLPAVQSAREAARRMKCTNSLKQVVLAMHTHHDALSGFPPCRTTPANTQHGWVVNLLPYMEQSSLYDVYLLDKNFYAVENQPAVTVPLTFLQCPSTPNGERTMPLGLGATVYGTKGVAADYFVNHLLNSSSAAAAGLNCSPCRPILFVQNGEENKLHPMSKITDGTSNTAFITEQAGRNDHYIKRKMQATNSGLTSYGWWGAWPSYMHFQYQGYTADGIALGTACSMNCNNGQGIYAFHPGGSNVGFADGSVRFVAETVPVSVMTMMLTRDGGEIAQSE